MRESKLTFIRNEWRQNIQRVIEGEDPLRDPRNLAAYANLCADLDDQDASLGRAA
jgi:hypothetical protein